MTKLWCIAIALGDPAEGMVVVSMQAGGLPEMAVAQAMSDVYRQTGTKLPLMGVNVRELTREYLESVLKEMAEDEGEQKVIPLPRIVGGVMQPTAFEDLHPAEQEMLRCDHEFAGGRCNKCGIGWQEFHMSRDPAAWSDREIANAFGQSKTKREIEQIAGRAIDWATIERGDPAA